MRLPRNPALLFDGEASVVLRIQQNLSFRRSGPDPESHKGTPTFYGLKPVKDRMCS